MNRKIWLYFLVLAMPGVAQNKTRGYADTIGFAHTAAQMDSVIHRINTSQNKELTGARNKAGIKKSTVFKTVIAPHDDYTYTGYLYPLALENIKAKTIILFGVAHKAKSFKVENQLVFDSYTYWSGPYGKIQVSPLRDELIAGLDKSLYQVNDTLQKMEHSVEAEIPFLQYYNRNIEIISILVPHTNFEQMSELSSAFAKALAGTMKKHNLKWGKDIAFVISADAVHYGDEEWGGSNFAFYGADSTGYKRAVAHEHVIIDSCLAGKLDISKMKLFTHYTVKDENYKEYKWTWCGRYSVPAGLLASYYLCKELKQKPLQGTQLGYSTSISNNPVHVNDLGGMGVTAKAYIRHWVGYAAIGFK
ncbi:MAG: AmmeMemoRadiSam system protein B [Bacteroidetes bacterium]|nr:AmmeMemoRadiSam system protein B [Bacteroidota bacterium]